MSKVKFNEATYIALTDLAKLRCIARLLSEVFNRDAIVAAGQCVHTEIDRLEKLIDAQQKERPHD